MAPSSSSSAAAAAAAFPVGTLVWVEADKADLSQDEVGEVVEDPRSSRGVVDDDDVDVVTVKLKISNTRRSFPARRLRLFDPEATATTTTTSTSTTTDAPAAEPPRRSARKPSSSSSSSSSRRVITPSPVPSSTPGRFLALSSETESEPPVTVTAEEGVSGAARERRIATTETNTETARSTWWWNDGDGDGDGDAAPEPVPSGSGGAVAERARTGRRLSRKRGADSASKATTSTTSNPGADETGPAAADGGAEEATTGDVPADEPTVAAAAETKRQTPSQKKKRKRGAPVPDGIRSDGAIGANDDDDDELLIDLKKKAASKRKKPPASEPSAAKKRKTKPAAKKKPTAKKKPATKKKPTAKKKPATKKKPAAEKTPKKLSREQMPLIAASESDSDDEKDRPFRVEHAATGRATCKSCDERIEKNALRVSSRPLFRGKPGFVVYRHLACQTFPEEITKVEEVGGWRRLTTSDRGLLAKQLEESKLRIEEENQELDADELVQDGFRGEIREAPAGCAATLLPFQREGVSWMVHQERSEVAGGILADEMGMGKTVQTITTILDNRPKLQHSKPGAKHPPSAPDLDERMREGALWETALESCHHDLEMADVPKQVLQQRRKTKAKGASSDPIGARGGTLVICPLIALYQWREEILKFTEADALSVCIYHGNDRHEKFPREILTKHDVVLTTYQVLEADFRKMVSPNKVKCPNCGRSFKMDKLGVHLRYFCGETAQRTAAQSRQRRSSDHPQQRQQHHGGNRGGGGAAGRGGGKKPPTTTTTTRTTNAGTKKKIFAKTKATKTKKKIPRTSPPPRTPSKAVRRPRKPNRDDDDDDSEASPPVDFDPTVKRRSRAAARTATERLSASAKEWAAGGNYGDDDDSSGFSEDDLPDDSSSDDDESLDAAPPPMCTVVPSKGRGRRRRGDGGASDSSSNLDTSSDEKDREAMMRSRARQRTALAAVKRRTKKGSGKKSFGKKKKKMADADSSSEEEEDDDDDDDPLRGIDMDALREKAMQGCRASVLHTVSWWRIVLDEAHNIKSRSSSTSSAAFHLTGIHRWCLSGTPLQNRVGELYSLIRFLRIDPMAHYFCRQKGVDCKSIYYRMEHGKCKNCGCASSQHYSYFNKHVLNVIQREGYTGDGRRAMMKLKTEVLDKCLLRRTKESRAEDMNLPSRFVTIKPIRLHPREEDFYNALYTQTKSSFDDYVQEGTLLNNYAHIFDLLTKMRQAVDHPYLIVYSKKNHAKLTAAGGGGSSSSVVANGSTLCELCGETPTDRILSSCCRSAFCRGCVVDLMNTLMDAGHGSTRCPCCRAPFTIDVNQPRQDRAVVDGDDDDGVLAVSDAAGMPSLREMRNVASGSILRRINLAEYSTSTKLEALVEELYAMRKERPGSKALVFSQFTSMLDLCRWRLVSDPCLRDLGLGVRIVHGGMNVKSRDEALKAFKEDPRVRVLLMSLKAGGVALNLTVANEVYLLDPWWNPAAEMQAIDRTHRLGQHRPIRAVRFIAEGTVEERVLQLQEKKRLVFDGTVGRDAASLKMLTVNDMKALFT